MELGLKAFTSLEAALIYVFTMLSTSGASSSDMAPYNHFFLQSRKMDMDFHISENG